MKQKHFYQFTLFILMVFFVLLGCSKQGPAGLTGPQGPVGPGGSKGDTGTANVIYSKWDSSFSGTSAIWNVPQITRSILDSGVILVYFRAGAATYQLNYSVGSTFIIYWAVPGQIQIVASGDLAQYSFRYVIIPGGVSSGNSIPKDYKLLCQQYNISQNS
jgi:hypothetical protein